MGRHEHGRHAISANRAGVGRRRVPPKRLRRSCWLGRCCWSNAHAAVAPRCSTRWSRGASASPAPPTSPGRDREGRGRFRLCRRQPAPARRLRPRLRSQVARALQGDAHRHRHRRRQLRLGGQRAGRRCRRLHRRSRWARASWSTRCWIERPPCPRCRRRRWASAGPAGSTSCASTSSAAAT